MVFVSFFFDVFRWFAVFDGHGGWQCSDYVSSILHHNFQHELNNHLGFFPSHNKRVNIGSSLLNHKAEDKFTGNISSRIVVKALKAAFQRTDRQFMSKVTGAVELGFGRDTRAGSCALAVFILDGVLFCANTGDCRAIVVSSKNVENNTKSSLNRLTKFLHGSKENKKAK